MYWINESSEKVCYQKKPLKSLGLIFEWKYKSCQNEAMKKMCITRYHFVIIFMYFSSRLPISDSKRSSMSGLMTSLSTIKRILCAWAKWEFGQHYPVEPLGRRRRGLASVSVGLWSFYHRDKQFHFFTYIGEKFYSKVAF